MEIGRIENQGQLMTVTVRGGNVWDCVETLSLEVKDSNFHPRDGTKTNSRRESFTRQSLKQQHRIKCS